jgi:hypothetical protein
MRRVIYRAEKHSTPPLQKKRPSKGGECSVGFSASLVLGFVPQPTRQTNKSGPLLKSITAKSTPWAVQVIWSRTTGQLFAVIPNALRQALAVHLTAALDEAKMHKRWFQLLQAHRTE